MPPFQNIVDFSLLPVIKATIPIHTNVRDLGRLKCYGCNFIVLFNLMLESNVMEGIPISENIEGNVEEPMHKQPRVGNVSKSVEQVVVDPNVLASWEHKVNSLMEEFFKEKLTLKVYLENGKPNIKIDCEIYGIDYGTWEVSLVV